VPAFNCARFLGEALDSIFAQTYRPIEIIVVDDGSTDNSADVAARYGERLTLVRQDNGGPGAARNTGFRHARGALIACIDADDHIHPRRIEVGVAPLLRDPKVAGSHVRCVNFWDDDSRAQWDIVVGKPVTQPHRWYGFGSLIFRRELIDSVGDIRTNLTMAEDIDWISRAEAAGHRFEDIDEVLYFRRVHQGNMTRSMTGTKRADLATVVQGHMARARKTR
jgi:glycosyltransferase involved in cell wall biosynthesis